MPWHFASLFGFGEKEASDEKANKEKSTFQDFPYKNVISESVFRFLFVCFDICFINSNFNSYSETSWKPM